MHCALSELKAENKRCIPYSAYVLSVKKEILRLCRVYKRHDLVLSLQQQAFVPNISELATVTFTICFYLAAGRIGNCCPAVECQTMSSGNSCHIQESRMTSQSNR